MHVDSLSISQFFHEYYLSNHMIFLVQFGINKHSCKFVSLWKNLLLLIYSKLHSKSRDYLSILSRQAIESFV